MKAEGFCSDHGIDNKANKGPVPPDLMCVAQATMPRLLLRLLLHFREHHSSRGHSYNYERAAKDCDDYCSMLMDFNNMGEIMRRIMTRTLIDPEVSQNEFVMECFNNFIILFSSSRCTNHSFKRHFLKIKNLEST